MIRAKAIKRKCKEKPAYKKVRKNKEDDYKCSEDDIGNSKLKKMDNSRWNKEG